MELKISDREQLSIFADGIHYLLIKNHLGFELVRVDGQHINVDIKGNKVVVDGSLS